MKTVVVTDGKYRTSIAAVRSLRKAGYEVVVTQTRDDCAMEPPVFSSRYVSECRWIDGGCADEGYAEKLLSLLKEYDRPVLFPIGAVTLNTLARNRERFAEAADFTVAAPEALDALNDKEAVHRRCVELGIPAPVEYEGVPDAYPVVIKPHCGEKFGLKAEERYAIANNEEEFKKHYARMKPYDPIVQKKVEGSGMGVSLLIDKNGALVTAICHRRVREYPISGGPTSCCVSFYDEGMVNKAYKLLSSFGFSGFAMVEFKGENVLEVNPRIWGSFPLTYRAGSPFSELYVKASAGKAPAYKGCDYKVGARMRYLINDTLAALHYLKAGRIKEGLKGLFSLFTVRDALWDWRDVKVFLKYIKFTFSRS